MPPATGRKKPVVKQTRSSKRIQEQSENIPHNIETLVKGKKSPKNSTRKDTIPKSKSPVLRDRTNTVLANFPASKLEKLSSKSKTRNAAKSDSKSNSKTVNKKDEKEIESSKESTRIRGKKGDSKKFHEGNSVNLDRDKMVTSSQNEKRTLRPRRNLRNDYKESRLIHERSIDKNKSDNGKEVIDTNDKKLPIWRSVKFESKPKTGDVYDISEGDFSNEEPRRNKRKRARKTVKKSKKITRVWEFGKATKPVKSKEILKKSKQVPKKIDLVEQIPKSGPKIISVEVLNHKNNSNTVANLKRIESPKEFKPFRVTQFQNRGSSMQKKMSNHSFFSKSMSPITKVVDNINPGTPWRLPTTEYFSSVRGIVQSTPQEKIIKKEQSYPHFPVQDKTIEQRLQISGIEGGKLKDEEEINRHINNKNPFLNKSEISRVELREVSVAENSFIFNYDENKENATPSTQNPHKSPKKNTFITTPVLGAQPGPSGLQRQPLSTTRVLRQINLNDFLNLQDTPERSAIKTPHGIFDDLHSDPISAKSLKKASEPDIQNAFGFDDDEDSGGESAKESTNFIESPKAIVPHKRVLVEKKRLASRKNNTKYSSANPTRLANRNIMKTLAQSNLRTKKAVSETVLGSEEKQKMIANEEKIENEENKKPESGNNNLSDTFDILDSKAEQNNNLKEKEDTEPPPLFTDVEPPIHFSTPPKSMYKRKRRQTTSFSEDSEKDEIPSPKKGKIKKVKKENQKLEEWAQSINKTFEEIDHYDLLIE